MRGSVYRFRATTKSFKRNIENYSIDKIKCRIVIYIFPIDQR